MCNSCQDNGLELWFTCTQVAASREVLPGRQDLHKLLIDKEDLPKSATASVKVDPLLFGCIRSESC